MGKWGVWFFPHCKYVLTFEILSELKFVSIISSSTEMSKRNKIFRSLHAHFKNEHNLDDPTARSFAKRALYEFRSSGSKAVTRTSELCNNEPAVNCDSSSRFRTIEGICNNLESPYLGAFDNKFIRVIEVEPYDAKNNITISDPDLGTIFQSSTTVPFKRQLDFFDQIMK